MIITIMIGLAGRGRLGSGRLPEIPQAPRKNRRQVYYKDNNKE